ncbi:hypothetical protein MBLNU230_g1567t1 [Neophaeotheca triangularis]
MSADDIIPNSKPLSVSIPKSSAIHGPYCPRRPNLREILANTAPAPWTLAAFMAYLSNNHCLETLEFTMDAGRYKKHYSKMLSRGTPTSQDKEYVALLWQRLIEAYIQPNGSREVNLPSEVRDPILNLETTSMPPTPETLDPAVAKIYELMEESVLVPFLNSVYPQAAPPTISSCPITSEESLPQTANPYDNSNHHHGWVRRNRHTRSSPPPQTAVEPHAHSYSAPSNFNRKSAPSTLTANLTKTRMSSKFSPTSSHVGSGQPFASLTTAAHSYPESSGPGMTDDSGSTGSPVNDSPMTPPTSPPMSELGSPNHSPRTSRDSGMWKKLGRLSGMGGMKVGRKKSGGLKEEE